MEIYMFNYSSVKIDKYIPIGDKITTGRSSCRALILRMKKGDSILLPDEAKRSYFRAVAKGMDVKTKSRAVGPYPHRYRVWRVS